MTDWDLIEYGFNSADETINFGPRIFGELHNLYETSTLVSIKSSNECFDKNVCVRAIIKNESLFFSINKTMRVFRNLQCSELIFNATFEDEIDTFLFNTAEKCLLLCLRSGEIYCMNIENFAVIFNEVIFDNNAKNERFFLKAFIENDNFVIVLKNGKIYRIEKTNDEFKSNLLIDLNCKLHDADFINPLMVLVGEEVIIYDLETDGYYSDEIGRLKQSFLINNRIMLGLDFQGCLINICTKSLLTTRVNSSNLYEDILVIHHSNILAITKNTELNHSYLLQLLSYPEYSVTFSLKMSEPIHFVVPENIYDECIYISEIKQEDHIDELRFQVVSETSPEDRFKRFLKRQKFNEAEQLAKLFSLDSLEMQKARAQMLVNETICNEADVTDLLNILKDIDEYNFKVQSCLDMHFSCTTLEDVDRVLNYAYSQIASGTSDKERHLETAIIKLTNCFNTFMQLAELDDNKNSVDKWVDFSESNCITELHIALEQGQIEEAIIIYTTLDPVTISNLEEQDIRNILGLLNISSMGNQVSFLKRFLHHTLLNSPSSINLFLKWITEKVFQIEMRNPCRFPQNAIDFIKEMEYVLKINNCNYRHLQISDDKNQLAVVVVALKQLQILKNDYHMMLSLAQLLEPTPIIIETLLSNVVNIIGNDFSITKFIRKILYNGSYEFDQIFTDVIQGLMIYEEEYWIKNVHFILDDIVSMEFKLKSVLIILDDVKVPWSDPVRELAHKFQQYQHPLVEHIKEKIKLEPKQVIFQKDPYRINSVHSNEFGFTRFAMNRIIYCNQPTMIDDIYTICDYDEEKHEANILLINHFIKESKFEVALEILDKNTKEERKQCCKDLLQFVRSLVETEYMEDTLKDQYMEIIGSVVQRLQKDSSDFEIYNSQRTLENIRSIYNIRKHFGCNLTCKILTSRVLKNEALTNLITDIAENSQNHVDVYMVMKQADLLASYFGTNKNLILLTFCQKLQDFGLILRAATDMYMSDTDSESLCRMAALMLKFLGSREIELDIYVDGLILARKMIVQAVLKCKAHEIGSCLELANWIQTGYFVTQHVKKNNLSCLNYVYNTHLVKPSILAVKSIKDVLCLYVKLMGDGCNHLSTHFLTYFSSETSMIDEIQTNAELDHLQSIVKYLSIEGHSMTAYKLIGTLQRSLAYNSKINVDFKKGLNDILEQSRKNLLQSVISKRHVDTDLTCNLLLSCDKKDSIQFLFHCLKSYKLDVSKFKTIAEIRLRMLRLYNITDGQKICVDIIYLAKWWGKIKHCRVPYDQFFRDTRKNVLNKLIEASHCDIYFIQEFCADFQMETQGFFEFYLKHLLVNWKPDFEIKTSVWETQEIFMKNGKEQLIEDCMEAVGVIGNKEALCKMLNHLWDSINFYHYEVFDCILHLLSKLDQDINYDKVSLLDFLKKYRRVNKPSCEEIMEWSQLYPHNHNLDPLSTWRLPFMPGLLSKKIYKIIKPEITLKTYTQWLEAVFICNNYLTKDDIYSMAIKKTVSSGLFEPAQSNEWSLCERHTQTLTDIDLCVRNMSNLEKATGLLYYISSHIPGGVDQVTGIKLCFKYALKYKNEFPELEEAKNVFKNVKKKYFTYSTMHILHANQLANEHYLAMASGPVHQLIEDLYMDNRIIKNAALITDNCPDINKAVDELAELHNIDMQEKRFALLNTWLSGNSNIDLTLDSTAIIDTNNQECDFSSDKLIRAAYLCTSGDLSKWRLSLLKLHESTESESLNLRINALKLFCSISDQDTVAKLTSSSLEDLHIVINKLTILSNLERYGFSLTIETLDQYNKCQLINSLALHLSHRAVVRSMALICTTYLIYDCKTWELIINAMLKLHMFQELKEDVRNLERHLTFNNKQFYINGWQALINHSFGFTFNIKNDHLEQLCIDNFNLILSCPVLHNLDLEYVTKQCIDVKQFNFAALAIKYLTKEKQKLYFKELFKLDKHIHSNIDLLLEQGFVGTSHIKNLIIKFNR